MVHRRGGNKKNKNKSMIINKIQGWPQVTQPITTNKNDNNQQGRSQQYKQLQPARTIRTAKCNNNHQHLILHSYLCHHHAPGKPPPTKTGRLIQPNNLLNVLTANVQSLLPKIDELIALIQVENFDVIALNETWLDTQNKHLFAEVSIHGTKFFMWTNQLHQEGEVD